MLWMFQRVMFGELDNPKNQKLLDLNAREIGIMVPLIVMIFVMGIYPKPFIDKMDPAIKKLVTQIRPASMDAKKIPAIQPMQGMPAAHPGMEMPAGHPGAQPVSEPQAVPAVNPNEAK
jgi:NADH-quinone oxidoreductase subunit M